MQVSGRLRCVGLAAAASVAVFACARPVDAALIAAWNFNTYVAGDHVVAADWGTGTMTIDPGWLGADLDTDVGTLFNGYLADPAGNAITLKDPVNNGRWIEYSFSTAGLQDLVLTMATQKGGQGFNSNQVSYSTDGVGYTNFGAPYNPADWDVIQTFDFSAIAAVENQPQVFIRIVLNGGSGNQNTNNNMDNVQLNATVIPEPGSIALLGLAALIGFRRRRRA